MDEHIRESLKTYRRESFLRKLRLINISVIYVVVMACLFMVIYAANQQRNTNDVKVKYTRPTYTVTFDPNGGSCSTTSKSVQLGENYDTLPTPTRSEHDFLGWTLNGTTITPTSQNTTVGNHTLVASWKLWPDLPSSAGATFVNTQALQNSSGDRGKRVVQINTTKNASGTARTYKYSWNGSTWTDGSGSSIILTKTSTGDQTLYVRVYPTGGEHYLNYVQTSIVVHLNKLPMPYCIGETWTGFSGGWYIKFQRKCGGALVWAKTYSTANNDDHLYISRSTYTSFDDDDWHIAGKWSGTMFAMTKGYDILAFHSCNGYVDSDVAVANATGNNNTDYGGQSTYYYTTDDGRLTTQYPVKVSKKNIK